MKILKLLISILLIATTFFTYSQEKTNYNKDIYPLIKDSKFSEAIPLLEKFLSEKPTHLNANYWYAKIMEIEALRLSDVAMIKKAQKHYMICYKEASELDMTMATAGRFPDVKGFEASERLINFKDFLQSKAESLNQMESKIYAENEKKQRDFEQKEFNEKQIALKKAKEIEENAKIKEETVEGLKLQELNAILHIQELLIFYEGKTTDELTFKGSYNYNIIDGKKTLNGNFKF